MGRMKLAESSGGSSLIPMAISSDNVNGLVLALSSSLFIGASFIIKKKGLKRAGASGVRAGMYVFVSRSLDTFNSFYAFLTL